MQHKAIWWLGKSCELLHLPKRTREAGRAAFVGRAMKVFWLMVFFTGFVIVSEAARRDSLDMGFNEKVAWTTGFLAGVVFTICFGAISYFLF